MKIVVVLAAIAGAGVTSPKEMLVEDEFWAGAWWKVMAIVADVEVVALWGFRWDVSEHCRLMEGGSCMEKEADVSEGED